MSLLFLAPNSAKSQVCDNPVPYTIIDLSATPTSTFTATIGGNTVVDPCCASQAANNNCQEFLFIMHPDAAGIQFTQPVPPVQCAINIYNLNGGCPVPAPTGICDPFCDSPVLNPNTGNYELRLTICKTGSFNETQVSFESIESAEFVGVTVGQGCDKTLTVTGTAEPVDWSCTTPASLLDYLNCGSGPGVNIDCANPTFNYTGPLVVNCAGLPLVYCVTPNNLCAANNVTATIVVYPNPADYTPVVTVSCANGIPTLTATVPGFPCPSDLTYQWLDPNNNAIMGANSDTYSPGVDDGLTYCVQIQNSNAADCPPVTACGIAACCEPLITCPGDLTVECPNSNEIGDWLGNYSVEACGDPFSVTNNFSQPTTCGTYTVTFNLVINNIIVSSCMSTLTVVDNADPVLMGCPAPTVDLGCNPVVPTCANVTPPTAMDNCGPAPVSCSETTISVNGCLRTKTITWTATDVCNNTASCSTIYTWQVVTVPVFANCTNTTTDLGCNPVNLPTCDATVTASNECGPVTVNCVPGAIVVNGCNRTQVFTYTATGCGLTSTCTRTFTWQVVTAPVFANCTNTTTDLGCNPTNLPTCDPTVSASNECGPVTVNCVPGAITSNGCNRTQVFTYTATGCGLSSTCTRTFTWQVATAPVFTNCGQTIALGCNPATLPTCANIQTAPFGGQINASNECGNVAGIVCDPGQIVSNGCNRTQVFTFTVSACGLVGSSRVDLQACKLEYSIVSPK